jgi:predicted transposase YdaD
MENPIVMFQQSFQKNHKPLVIDNGFFHSNKSCHPCQFIALDWRSAAHFISISLAPNKT